MDRMRSYKSRTRSRWRDASDGAVSVALLIIGAWYLWSAWNAHADCEAAGGVLVHDAIGMLECVRWPR